jgi:hypothetical protein
MFPGSHLCLPAHVLHFVKTMTPGTHGILTDYQLLDSHCLEQHLNQKWFRSEEYEKQRQRCGGQEHVQNMSMGETEWQT